MNVTKVYDNLAILSVLMNSDKVISGHAKNEELIKVLDEKDYENTFPIYFTWLKKRFDVEVKKQRLRKTAAKILSNLLNLNDPNHLVNQNILNYLPDEHVLLEFKERLLKERNIIIFNLPESSAGTLRAQNQEDAAATTREIRSFFDLGSCNTKVTRLGVRSKETIRPIKVILPSRDVVISLLKSKINYKGNCKFASDRTQIQREHHDSLKREVNEINRNGKIKVIKYIEGIPRIVDINDSTSASTSSKNDRSC